MKHKHFPLFLNIEQKKVLVIGGGNIALRRVKTLLKFDFEIKIITLEICENLKLLASDNEILVEIRKFNDSDLDEIFMLILCTNNKMFNSEISVLAQNKGVLTSNCTDKKQCDFYFPAVHTTDDLIIGLVGDGNDHKKVSDTKKIISSMIGGEI